MPTKRVTTVTEEEAPEDAQIIEVVDDDEDEIQALDALEGMISEFSGAADAVVNVYRQGEGKNLSFLFRTNPDEMTGGEIMERCRDHYGTGDYRIHIRKGPRLVANKPFSVEAKQAPDPATVQTPQMGVAEILAIMQASNDRMANMFSESMRAMAEAFKGRDSAQVDPVAMQSTIMQSVAALKQMTEKPDTSKDAVEMLIQGLTLAKDLSPRDGETNSTDVLLKAIEQFGPPLVNAAAAGAAPGAPGNGQMGPPQDPQAAADAAREREMGIRQQMIRQQLGFLVQNAAAGKNPELYAELLLDQLGERVVLDFIGKPDAMDQLIAIDGNVAQFRPWFESVRAAILELTGEPGDTDGIPPNGAPIVGDVIIPGHDAISDAADDGDASGDTVGASGDTGNA